MQHCEGLPFREAVIRIGSDPFLTDASLLWDTSRVASRWLVRAREIAPESCPHRFHDRKIKRLYLFVTRYLPSKSAKRQQKVKVSFRTLIERVEWIVAMVREFSSTRLPPASRS